MEPFKLYKDKVKKYKVYIPNKVTGRLRKVSFGAKGYSDYTMHKDKARRLRYIQRHKHDKLNDPFSSGFWSMYVLWGKSTNIKIAFKDAVRRAKLLLKI
jgi:hypothetical protein